jgi:hypothetical protein
MGKGDNLQRRAHCTQLLNITFAAHQMSTERMLGMLDSYHLPTVQIAHALFLVCWDLELPLSRFPKNFMSTICSLPFLEIKMPQFVERQPRNTMRNKNSFPGH